MLHLAALALAPSPILSTRSRLAKPAVGAASSGALAGGPQPPPRSPQDDNSRKQQWIPGGGRAPSYLDGSLAGDRGFDPKCLVVLARTRTRVDSGPWAKIEREARMVMCSEWEAKKKLYWMREAEMKHARLAMVAAAGWPISELLDKPLSAALGLASPLDATGGRAPSLLNGHLFDNSLITAFLVAVAIATAALELSTLDNVEGLTPTGYVPGDLGFDPLGLNEKRAGMDEAEIKHGRLAMLAVTGFAVQEAIYGTPVIEQTPQFFWPALPFF